MSSRSRLIECERTLFPTHEMLYGGGGGGVGGGGLPSGIL